MCMTFAFAKDIAEKFKEMLRCEAAKKRQAEKWGVEYDSLQGAPQDVIEASLVLYQITLMVRGIENGYYTLEQFGWEP